MKKNFWPSVLVVAMLVSVFSLANVGDAKAAYIDLPVSPNFETSYVYRFYSPVFLGHFYTTDWNEAMQVANYDSNWDYEGIIGEAFDEFEAGRTEVYRFWSPVFLGHFYTSDYDEMVKVRDKDSNWEYEGIAYYAYPTETNYASDPVYRFWSPIFLHHFYTTDYDEYMHVKHNDSNWFYEGEAWNLPQIAIV